jgi:hypothetical protein
LHHQAVVGGLGAKGRGGKYQQQKRPWQEHDESHLRGSTERADNNRTVRGSMPQLSGLDGPMNLRRVQLYHMVSLRDTSFIHDQP